MNKSIISLLFTACSFLCIGQNHEFISSIALGAPTKNFKKFEATNATHFEHRQLDSYNKISFHLDYQYKISNSLNVFFGAGLGYSRTHNALPLYSTGEYEYLVENISIPYHRINFRVLSIGKRVQLNQNTSLHLQATFDIQKNINPKNNLSSNLKFNTTNWIEYEYDIKTFNQNENNSVTPNWNLNFLKQLKKGQLLFGVRIDRRLEYWYDYTATFKYYINGSVIPTSENDISHVSTLKEEFSYISFNIGYVFGLGENQ